MPHTDRRRFVALAAVGLAAVGGGAVATAQTGMGVALGSGMGSVRVTGLEAGYSSLASAAGPSDAGSPVVMVTLHDVTLDSVCVRLRSVHVPMIGTVTLVIDLPPGSRIHADSMVIEADDLAGDVAGTVDFRPAGDLAIGPGAGGTDPTSRTDPSSRTDRSGTGLSVRPLRASTLDLHLAGLHAENLRTEHVSLRAVTGEATC